MPHPSAPQHLPALQRAFFWTGALLPLPSIALYLLTPGGTVKHFNGDVSDTSKFWCSVTASGDAVVAYLSLVALWTSSDEVRKVVLRANALYSVFHFGAFWFWHRYGTPHRSGAMYPVSIAIAVGACAAWGR